MVVGLQSLCWLTDTHLNTIPTFARKHVFANRIKKIPHDRILITGDITTGKYLRQDLTWLAQTFSESQIYFVLGNHDYYGAGFSGAWQVLESINRVHPNLHWLSWQPYVELSEKTALIGHEGWYSGSYGDPTMLYWTLDWLNIPEMFWMKRAVMYDFFRVLASASANVIRYRVESALEKYDHVIVATHFPAFPQSTPDHILRSDFWLSYSVNAPLGTALRDLALKHPSKQITVLAGHTHHATDVRIEPNLRCLVGHQTSWRVKPATRIVQYT